MHSMGRKFQQDYSKKKKSGTRCCVRVEHSIERDSGAATRLCIYSEAERSMEEKRRPGVVCRAEWSIEAEQRLGVVCGDAGTDNEMITYQVIKVFFTLKFI